MGHLLLATTYGRPSGGGFIAVSIIWFLVYYLCTALGMYGAFAKAGTYGQPKWAAFVPLYRFIIMLRVAGRPRIWGWFLLLYVAGVIPLVGVLASIGSSRRQHLRRSTTSRRASATAPASPSVSCCCRSSSG